MHCIGTHEVSYSRFWVGFELRYSRKLGRLQYFACVHLVVTNKYFLGYVCFVRRLWKEHSTETIFHLLRHIKIDTTARTVAQEELSAFPPLVNDFHHRALGLFHPARRAPVPVPRRKNEALLKHDIRSLLHLFFLRSWYTTYLRFADAKYVVRRAHKATVLPENNLLKLRSELALSSEHIFLEQYSCRGFAFTWKDMAEALASGIWHLKTINNSVFPNNIALKRMQLRSG